MHKCSILPFYYHNLHIIMKTNHASSLYLLQEQWNCLHRKRTIKCLVSIATTITWKELWKEKLKEYSKLIDT